MMSTTIEFVRRASPDQWSDHAMELRHALDLLDNLNEDDLIVTYSSETGSAASKSHVSRTWLLLAGFAIENLLKGLLIAENPSYVSNGHLSRKARHHCLTRLAERLTSIRLNQGDMVLLSLLESALPSWGRYPIPLSAEDVQEEEFAECNVRTRFATLFDKIDHCLYERIKNGWDGPNGFRLKGVIRSDLERLPIGWEGMAVEDVFSWRAKHARAAHERRAKGNTGSDTAFLA